MVTTRYTQWDGTQQLRLDADKVFEKLAEYLSYTDDVRQAMDWMMRQGMDFDGTKVMGLEEFLEQLRQEMRQRYRDFNLRNSLSDLEQRLEDILQRERQTLSSLRDSKPGMEEKERQLQHILRRLSEALRKLESYEFEDEQARADVEEFRDHLDGGPARDAGAAGRAGFSEPAPGDDDAGAVRLHRAKGRPSAAFAQGRAPHRPARAARHLPGPAQGSRRHT